MDKAIGQFNSAIVQRTYILGTKKIGPQNEKKGEKKLFDLFFKPLILVGTNVSFLES